MNKPEGEIYKNTIQLDITNYSEVEKFIASIKSQTKEITLINCAGITANAFAHKSGIEEWNL